MAWQQEIEIIVSAKNTASKPLKEVSKTVEEITATGRKVTKTLDYVAKNGKKVTKTIETTTKGMKNFRMELLSTMFYGQQMAQTFGSMTSTGFEALGIYEQFNWVMEDIMTTTLEPLVPVFDGVADTIEGMSDEQKMLIGTSLLAGQAAGTMMNQYSQLGLLMDSLQQQGLLAGIPGMAGLQTAAKIGIEFVAGKGMTPGGVIQDMFSTSAPWVKFGTALSGIYTVWMAISLADTVLNATGDGVITTAELNKILGGGLKTAGGAMMWYGLSTGNPYLFAAGFALQLISIEGIEQAITYLTDLFSKPWNMWTKYPAFTPDLMPWQKANRATGTWDWNTYPKGFTEDVQGNRSPLKDFIMRPGSGPVSFSPDDTIIGTKGGMPGGNVFNVTQNISVGSIGDIDRVKRELGDELMHDIASMMRR